MRWLSQGVLPSNGWEPNANVLAETAGETVYALQVFAATVVLIPILLFVVAAFVDRSAVLRRAQEDGRKTVALLHEQAANLFSGHEVILDAIVERVRALSWDAIASSENLLRDLEAMDTRLDEVSEILLVDTEGRVRATTVHGTAPPAMLRPDHDCFLSLGKSNLGTCISQPYIDAGTGRHLFSLCRRLEDGGAFKGIAQVAISADYFLDLWGVVAPNDTDIVVLVRSDGIVLAHYPKPKSEAVGLAVEEPFLSGIKRDIEGVITGRSSADNIDRIAVYKKIAGYSAYVGIGMDKNAALGEWHHSLLVYGAVSLAATLALMSAAGMVLRRARRERRAIALWRAEVKERENAQAQLLQSQKMDSIGQLTGGVAHDFNNLLTVILGNIDLAQEFERDGRGAKLLESALNAGERAAILTKRLLAFARQQHLRPMPVDLRRLIGEIEDMLIRTLGPTIRLSIMAEPELWPAQVDRNQIELIILNLAINARDAMPDGGSIAIALSNRKFTEGEATDLAAGEYVVLTVHDTGSGMDDATIARAFEPFFTTKEVGKGTGLGLSMVHGTVIQSGGAVRIRSKPAQGTAVEILLPRSREAPMTGHAAEAASAPEQGAGTILVCEDDPSVRTFVTEALENSGFRTIATADGPSALAILDADTPVDLLLADLAMPGMDGMMVARLAQESRPGLPILIITGYLDQKTVEAEASGVPVLRKPFKRAQLAARIAELLKESKGQDRTAH